MTVPVPHVCFYASIRFCIIFFLIFAPILPLLDPDPDYQCGSGFS
jgi:hypothetical protein